MKEKIREFYQRTKQNVLLFFTGKVFRVGSAAFNLVSVLVFWILSLFFQGGLEKVEDRLNFEVGLFYDEIFGVKREMQNSDDDLSSFRIYTEAEVASLKGQISGLRGLVGALDGRIAKIETEDGKSIIYACMDDKNYLAIVRSLKKVDSISVVQACD